MMNDVVALSADFLAGFLIGGMFFYGLWWTVRKGLNSKRPVLCFFGSSLLRMSVVLAGFYFISSGDWRRLLTCLIVFFVARIVVTHLTRMMKEGIHAS